MATKPKKLSRLPEIIAALPALTEKELAAVKAAINLLSQKNQLSEDEKLLFEAMLKALEMTMSWATFEATSAYKDFKTNAPIVSKFVDEISPYTKKAQQMGLLRYLIGLLISSFKDRKIPVTLGTVCKSLNTIPMIFDAAFPDYRESGLVHILLKQMERK